MTPAGDSARAGSPARLLAAGLALALAAVAVVAIRWWHVRDRDHGIELPAGERVRLAATVVPLLEAGLPDARNGGRQACAVAILGTEPADAATAQVVTTAYVWSLCRSIGTPVPGESQQAAVVHLGVPAAIEVPDMATLSTDIDRLFPKRLRDAAAEGAYSDELEAATDRRATELS